MYPPYNNNMYQILEVPKANLKALSIVAVSLQRKYILLSRRMEKKLFHKTSRTNTEHYYEGRTIYKLEASFLKSCRMSFGFWLLLLYLHPILEIILPSSFDDCLQNLSKSIENSVERTITVIQLTVNLQR